MSRPSRFRPQGGSTIKNYGVWAAQIVSFHVQPETTKSRAPHIYLNLDDGSGNTPECAINTKSIDKDSANLIYWFSNDFQHPLTQTLDGLQGGYQALSPDNALAMDFVRTSPPLIDINQGTELEADAGMGNEIAQQLEPIIQRAQDEKATVFLFGSRYDDSNGKMGIHDIHMNQGSNGFENSIHTDGCMIIKFSDHHEAVFLGFATQDLWTNDKGLPAKGYCDSLSNIVKNQSWPLPIPDGGDGQ